MKHQPLTKPKLLKGGVEPILRALSPEELDAQVQRDIEAAEKHAATRIEASKKACEERRKRKDSQPPPTNSL